MADPPKKSNVAPPSDRIDSIPRLIKDSTSRQYLPATTLLGTGGFASVFRASMIDRRIEPPSPECALKVVRTKLKSSSLQARFKFELGIHSKLHHPNIVEFYRAFTFQDLTYVALELCHNGSLTAMVKKRKFLTMGEIRRFLIQLCGAVKYLHSRDVVHRDIKAGNVLLDENMNAKLADFGLAATMEPANLPGVNVTTYARRTTFCGTPNYLAPELLSRDGHDKSVDVWALGILAYYLAIGRGPFHSKSKEEIYVRIRKGDYSWPDVSPDQNDVPEDLKSLIATTLVEESKRPTPDEIVQHPFFSHGYIFPKLSSLARTRPPRVSRAPSRNPGELNSTYDELCRTSRVGPITSSSNLQCTTTTNTKKKSKRAPGENEPVMLTLTREYQSGIVLTIPLPEGIVYEAWNEKPTQSKDRDNDKFKVPALPQKQPSKLSHNTALPTTIYEDPAEQNSPPAPPQQFHTNSQTTTHSQQLPTQSQFQVQTQPQPQPRQSSPRLSDPAQTKENLSIQAARKALNQPQAHRPQTRVLGESSGNAQSQAQLCTQSKILEESARGLSSSRARRVKSKARLVDDAARSSGLGENANVISL